jgi:hypothetical protein
MPGGHGTDARIMAGKKVHRINDLTGQHYFRWPRKVSLLKTEFLAQVII